MKDASNSAGAAAAVAPPIGGSQRRIDNSFVRDNVLHAGMRWVLHVVMEKMSFRSCDDVGVLFNAMFPNCPEAAKFSLKKTKCAYMINHGFAPFFLDLLLKNIKLFFSLSFDESLNKVLHSGQMDVNIRYWNAGENLAETRYFT